MDAMTKVALDRSECRLAAQGLRHLRERVERVAEAAARYGLDPATLLCELSHLDSALETLGRLDPLNGLDEVLTSQTQYQRIIAGVMVSATLIAERQAAFQGEVAHAPEAILAQFEAQRRDCSRLLDHTATHSREEATDLLRAWGLLTEN